MTNQYDPAPWWPPKPGDKLRHFTTHGAGDMRIKHVHALIHVLAVFEHDGETLATVAEWFPSRRRWHYETINALDSCVCWSKFWPDGEDPPEKHGTPDNPLACCRPGEHP